MKHRHPITSNVAFRAALVAAALSGAACTAETGSSSEPEPVYDSIGVQLGAITADIARRNAETDYAFGLLARLEIQENELLEFYEPSPGVVLISGAGAPRAPLKAASGMGDSYDLREVWTANAMGVAMPEELADALDRARHYVAPTHTRVASDEDLAPQELADDHTHDEPSARDENIGEHTEALHGSGWCNTTYETYDAKNSGGDTVWIDIGTCPSGFSEVHCWDHRTGTGYASNPDAYWARSNVCPYKGEVLFTVETDEPEDWDTGSWSVPQNTARWTANSQSCGILNDCPWFKTTVSQAKDDSYNYRFVVASP
jgi:hypothetical protein